MDDYLPLVVMLVLAVGFVLLSIGASKLLAPQRPNSAKEAPYESGIVPSREPPQRFPVKFFLVAMIFIVFDIEIIFLFAWASRYTELGWPGVAAVGIFTFFVLETLAYVWKRGALEWNIPRRERYRHEKAA